MQRLMHRDARSIFLWEWGIEGLRAVVSRRCAVRQGRYTGVRFHDCLFARGPVSSPFFRDFRCPRKCVFSHTDFVVEATLTGVSRCAATIHRILNPIGENIWCAWLCRLLHVSKLAESGYFQAGHRNSCAALHIAGRIVRDRLHSLRHHGENF